MAVECSTKSILLIFAVNHLMIVTVFPLLSFWPQLILNHLMIVMMLPLLNYMAKDRKHSVKWYHGAKYQFFIQKLCSQFVMKHENTVY